MRPFLSYVGGSSNKLKRGFNFLAGRTNLKLSDLKFEPKLLHETSLSLNILSRTEGYRD
jgi:hypothetical protein